jgi:transmembrane protein EpsG
MLLYLLTIFISTTLAFCATHVKRIWDVSGKNTPHPFFVWLLILVFVLISGFRYMNYYATDEYAYRLNYLSYSNMSFDSLLTTLGNEWGWDLLNWLLSRIFLDSQAIIFVCALVTNLIVIQALAKYAQSFAFSIFLYVAGGFYFASFNTMRQYLAMSILIWGITYIFKRNFWKYSLTVLIAASIHFSAWIMLPLYFVLKRKKFERFFFLLVLCAIVLMIYFDRIIFFILPSTGEYANYGQLLTKGGVNPLRTVAWLAPLLLIFFWRKSFLAIGDSNYLFLNFSLFSVVINLVALVFIYVARLDVYFGIFNLITLSFLVKIYNKKINIIIGLFFVAFFFLFGYYEASKMETYYNILIHPIKGLLYK